MDIRIKKMPFEYNGKIYQLCCNFNVLADLEEEYGEIPDVLSGKKMLKKITFLVASMMNDYADTMNWNERVTPREIGRVIDITDSQFIQSIMELLVSALYVKTDEVNTNIESKN